MIEEFVGKQEDSKGQFYLAKRNLLFVTTLMAVLSLGGIKIDQITYSGVRGVVSHPYLLFLLLGLASVYLARRYWIFRQKINLHASDMLFAPKMREFADRIHTDKAIAEVAKNNKVKPDDILLNGLPSFSYSGTNYRSGKVTIDYSIANRDKEGVLTSYTDKGETFLYKSDIDVYIYDEEYKKQRSKVERVGEYMIDGVLPIVYYIVILLIYVIYVFTYISGPIATLQLFWK